MAKHGGLVVVLLMVLGIGFLIYAGVIPSPFTISTPAPKGAGVFNVQVLSTSSTDATSLQAISSDGHTITFTMTGAQMDTLHRVELQMSVLNANTGSADQNWPFEAHLVSCGKVQVGGSFLDACARTADGSRFDVTYTLTQSGAPTGAQSGTTFTSSDWKTGASDILDANMKIDNAAVVQESAQTEWSIIYNVGGVTITSTQKQTTA